MTTSRDTAEGFLGPGLNRARMSRDGFLLSDTGAGYNANEMCCVRLTL
jgi:hypothetical protein